MLGTGDSVELAKEWLAQRCHELLLRVDERGALSLLLQNKATSLKQLKHAAKLGRVSLDKSTCELQLLGEASALEAARAWLKQNTQTHSLVVRDGFVRWIIGRKGAALKTNMQAMEKAAGSLVSVNLDQPTSSIEITGSQSVGCDFEPRA